MDIQDYVLQQMQEALGKVFDHVEIIENDRTLFIVCDGHHFTATVEEQSVPEENDMYNELLELIELIEAIDRDDDDGDAMLDAEGLDELLLLTEALAERVKKLQQRFD